MKTVDKVMWAAVIAVVVIAAGVFGGREVLKRAGRAARAAAEPWREVADWHGTAVGSSSPLPPPVLAAFEQDPPAPDKRKTIFAAFLGPHARYVCRGWYGNIESVMPYADGWEVTVKMRIRLSGTAFVSTPAVETWQISKAGFAHCVACEGEPVGPNPEMVD